jgi:hypothetical protein
LLEQSVNSNGDITKHEDVQGDVEEGKVEATDVEKAAIKMMCDEKAKDVKYIEPVMTNQAESGQVHLIT